MRHIFTPELFYPTDSLVCNLLWLSFLPDFLFRPWRQECKGGVVCLCVTKGKFSCCGPITFVMRIKGVSNVFSVAVFWIQGEPETKSSSQSASRFSDSHEVASFFATSRVIICLVFLCFGAISVSDMLNKWRIQTWAKKIKAIFNILCFCYSSAETKIEWIWKI